MPDPIPHAESAERIEHLERRISGLVKFLEEERLKTFKLEVKLREGRLLEEEKLVRPFKSQIEELTSKSSYLARELQDQRAKHQTREGELLRQLEEKERVLQRRAATRADPDESLIKMIRERVKQQSLAAPSSSETASEASFGASKRVVRLKKKEEGRGLQEQVEDLKLSIKMRKQDEAGGLLSEKPGSFDYQGFQEAYKRALP
jgi:hypothetical protein